MTPAPIPKNEAERLAALRRYEMLDTPAEADFDDFTRLASQICGTPIALVSLVDAGRQWFKSKVGLAASETPRDHAFCAHAIQGNELFEVPNALADERFHDNPLVTGDPSIRFYAGIPVHAGARQPVGTLCLIDRQPRHLGQEELAVLGDLAAMVEDLLKAAQSATVDALTGLFNRRGFDALASKALAVSHRLGSVSTLILFDLDDFKQVNDVHGHAAGDRALADFSEALLKTFRDADVVARFGGDEFCVLACASAASMAAPLGRLGRLLAGLLDRPYRIAFSAGTAETTHDLPLPLPALLAAADRAMYQDKLSHRSTG